MSRLIGNTPKAYLFTFRAGRKAYYSYIIPYMLYVENRKLVCYN